MIFCGEDYIVGGTAFFIKRHIVSCLFLYCQYPLILNAYIFNLLEVANSNNPRLSYSFISLLEYYYKDTLSLIYSLYKKGLTNAWIFPFISQFPKESINLLVSSQNCHFKISFWACIFRQILSILINYSFILTDHEVVSSVTSMSPFQVVGILRLLNTTLLIVILQYNKMFHAYLLCSLPHTWNKLFSQRPPFLFLLLFCFKWEMEFQEGSLLLGWFLDRINVWC